MLNKFSPMFILQFSCVFFSNFFDYFNFLNPFLMFFVPLGNLTPAQKASLEEEMTGGGGGGGGSAGNGKAKGGGPSTVIMQQKEPLCPWFTCCY